MSGAELLTLGVVVRCSDGPCGHLRRLIVDPAEAKLTFLAVRSEGLQPGRVVPAEQLVSGGSEVWLRCSKAEFADFELDEVRPGAGADPTDGLRGTTSSGAESFEQMTGFGNREPARELIPAGGVDLRRGEPVYAGERQVGRAEGLRIDLAHQLITHLVLAGGHFWGRKRVAVPIGHVTTFGDGIQLDLTKGQVSALPRIAEE